MSKIIHMPPRKPLQPRADERGLPPTLLRDGWWLGAFTILPADYFSRPRQRRKPGAPGAGGKSATIIPFDRSIRRNGKEE